MITFAFCFGVVIHVFKASGPEEVRENHSSSDDKISIIHWSSNVDLEKLIASAYSRSLLVGSLDGGYLGAVTTQSVEHHWGELQRVCNGSLTVDGLSSGVFRALGLRCLSATLGVCHTQPGRARTSGAILAPVESIDWSRVGTLG
jgi:hypothetical protein